MRGISNSRNGIQVLCAAIAFGMVSLAAIAADSSKGVELFEADKFEECQKFFEPILKSDPNNKDALYYLGRSTFDLNEYKDSAKYFETLVELDDSSSDYHLWLGRAVGLRARNSNMLVQGRLAPKIRDAFKRSAELDGTNLDARMGLLQYYVEAPGFLGGDVEKSKLEAAAIMEQSETRGNEGWGNIYFQLEDFDKAEEHFVKAIELGSEYGPAYANLGDIRHKQGKDDEAKKLYLQALEHDKSSEEAKNGLKELE